MSNYWSQYWQQGHLTSFGQDLAHNYEGPLKNVWKDVFQQANNQDSFVDIGTGNGALLELACQGINSDDMPEMVGIDLADVALPGSINDYSGKISIQGKIDATNMPFTSESKSWVISQFGIEYCAIKKVFSEVSRILSSSGKFQFICHHPDSIIVKPNTQILDMSRKLNENKGALSLLENLTKELIRSGRGSPKSESIRLKLNKKIEALLTEDQTAFIATYFPMFSKAVLSTSDSTLQKRYFAKFKEELAGSMMRLADLSQAAISDKRKSEIISACEQHNLVLSTFSEVYDNNGQLLAWRIAGSKVSD
ncbi:class I SAM-dependent methyltransferase [Thalassotalea sp. PS06]|uniref:class I SAM-dependent methyltransferase n=1 Tax=Thalassotalea sp. PS06 TaxID=2594005 RepID=UPI00163D51AB|nr:methyltransferase domain-containing protein [Thalassotalea sp. PS06]